MSDMIARGILTAEAGVLRKHETPREYPMVMEPGDILEIDGRHHAHFTQKHVFYSREDQDQFVADWKRMAKVG